jgi:hypothetical protein
MVPESVLGKLDRSIMRTITLSLCDWLGGSAAIKDNSQSKTLFGAVRQYKTSQDLPQPVHRSEALM